MDKEEAKSFLESNFKIIQGVINKACRRYNLDGGDADEFSSIVYEKLLDDDYKKIRSFGGSSSFSTYITAVISHIFIDTIIRPVKGRWKASKKALALGREAIELEELVLKNGYNIDQAIETLVENPDYSISKDDAYKMASKLELQKKSAKQKTKRSAKNPNTGNVEALEYTSDGKSISPEKVLINEEILHKKKKIEQSIKEMIELLTNEVRLIIKMRYYGEGKTVSEIARVLKRKRSYVDEKLNKIKNEFKNKLLSMGFGIDDVKDVIDFGSANQG